MRECSEPNPGLTQVVSTRMCVCVFSIVLHELDSIEGVQDTASQKWYHLRVRVVNCFVLNEPPSEELLGCASSVSLHWDAGSKVVVCMPSRQPLAAHNLPPKRQLGCNCRDINICANNWARSAAVLQIIR